MDILLKKIRRSFQLTQDLADQLKPQDLKLELGELPSNSIGQQLWCVIGARESYAKALEELKWVGFNCSLKDANDLDEIRTCLKRSGQTVLNLFNDRRLTGVQTELLLDLLEHEAQHHGQLIRYLYAHNMEFPPSWIARYHL